MTVEYVQVGKLELSLLHLKCFRLKELEQWVGKDNAAHLAKAASSHAALIPPLYAELQLQGSRILLSPGLSLVSGVELKLDRQPITLGLERDGDFLWRLLIDVPKLLERERNPVVVEDLEERFSRNVKEGVMYALDIMERVSRVYRIPFMVTGSLNLMGAWSWVHSIVKVRGERGESIILVDSEPLVRA